MSTAILVDHISKKFKLPHHKKTTLLQNAIGLLKKQMTYEEFWALKDVSFEVRTGETFGIIGRNGSGKSTLLKILAKVMYPDSGSITMQGKSASFLELGTGFQMELTASENIYLYSSILGKSRKETANVYEAILDFAELKRFEDMKLKNFSSGMYLRLAFSTAIYSDPNNILIDEVLAVGDEAFQKKCMQKIYDFRRHGKTIVVVSHVPSTIKQLCNKALLIDNGQVIRLGHPGKVISEYLSMIDSIDNNKTTAFRTKSLSANPVNNKYGHLIGVDSDVDIDSLSEPNYFVLSRFNAAATGIVYEILIKCSSSGNVKLAIYSDDNGEPGKLLGSINSDIAVTEGWNNITFPNVLLKVDKPYWLAFCSDTKISGTKETGNNIRRFRKEEYSSFKFPQIAGGNFTNDAIYYDLLAAWGDIEA